MARDSDAFASPVSTTTCQGWVLVPEGAREATARICSITGRGTGVGRNARSDRRDVIAASTTAASGCAVALWSVVTRTPDSGHAGTVRSEPRQGGGDHAGRVG